MYTIRSVQRFLMNHNIDKGTKSEVLPSLLLHRQQFEYHSLESGDTGIEPSEQTW